MLDLGAKRVANRPLEARGFWSGVASVMQPLKDTFHDGWFILTEICSFFLLPNGGHDDSPTPEPPVGLFPRPGLH